MGKEFLFADAVKILEIKESLLNQWMNRGFVKPSQPASGSGTRNIFSMEDIIRIELFKELIRVGFTRPAASAAAFDSRANIIDDLSFTIQRAIEFSNKDNPQPIFIAICKAKKYGKDASVLTRFVNVHKDRSILIDGGATGPFLESTVFHMINFTHIALKICKKIKREKL